MAASIASISMPGYRLRLRILKRAQATVSCASDYVVLLPVVLMRNLFAAAVRARERARQWAISRGRRQSGTEMDYRPPGRDCQSANATRAHKAALPRIKAGRSRNRLLALVVDPDIAMTPVFSQLRGSINHAKLGSTELP
jgi:hypothetical protein